MTRIWTDQSIDPRPISPEEAAVVRRALEVAPTDGETSALLATVDQLVVVGRCACGCASVHFCVPDDSAECGIVADAQGSAPSGGHINVILWACGPHIRYLEIVDYAESKQLPDPASLSPYGAS